MERSEAGQLTTMKLNRRNVLVGLGTIVAGGGVALGSGAFSSVEAHRSVDIGTAGDAEALIGIELTGDLEGEDGDTIAFDLEDDLNIDAVTTFNGALTITNNREDGDVDIAIEDEDDNDLIVADAESTQTGMNFVPETDGDQSGISPTESVVFDVIFDLEGETDEDDADDLIPESITIIATAA